LKGAQQLSDDLKDLLVKLLSKNPDARPSIADIKAHPFFNGPVPTKAEIIENGDYRRSILVKIRTLEIKLMKETAATLKPGVRKD
jgi:serine/threonine protein kinase